MSLSPNEKYPGATEADPNYKDSKFKDNNPSTTNNGSPLKALDRNEQLALQEAMMNAAGFDYNGVVDTPQNSQMFNAYKAALSNGANLLSNHNFIIASPDTTGPDATQPPPSATPTSYPPGFQIFSGVFANETTGILNLTYIDGRVSFSGGDFYMAVPNAGALENITEFVASVADFDGKPRTRGVSYALVGDEYRVTVGVDALEDESANETPLGSVKFEQGSVATGHEVNGWNRIEQWIAEADVRGWGAIKDGVSDDTTAILSAISHVESQGGGVVTLGVGKLRFTQEIIVPKHVTLAGSGYSTSANTAATILYKDGNFVGVKVLDAAQLKDVSVEGAPGNGDDGVALLGGRGILQNVSSHNHGQDGFKIGSYFGTVNNANLWRAFNLIAEGNGRDGLYASDDNGDFNCNAGLLVGYDASRNGRDGVRINLAGNNQWYGVTCQVNDGYGIYADNAKGNYIPDPYLEANSAGDAYYSENSGQNWHIGVRSSVNNGNITNLGNVNNIQDRNDRFESVWTTPSFFSDVSISGGNSTGNWYFQKDANRNLLIDLLNTTASAYLHFGSDGREQGIRISDGSILRKMRNQGTTINFGTVPANGTSDAAFSITGIDSDYALTVTPLFSLPAGVVITAYWDGSNAVARCANLTGSSIAISGACRLTAIKIGA